MNRMFKNPKSTSLDNINAFIVVQQALNRNSEDKIYRRHLEQNHQITTKKL
jgi:hypothetical protein